MRWLLKSEERTDRKNPPLMSIGDPMTALETLTCTLKRVSGSNPRDLRVARLSMSAWAPVYATAWVSTSGEVVFWPIWGLQVGLAVGF